MPYIGLCGLLAVSFSERAAMIAPLVPAAVPALRARIFMPRSQALSAWKARPKLESIWFGRFGVMLPGRPSLE